MKTTIRLLSAAVLSLAAVSCSSVPRDGGIGDLQKAIDERSAQKLGLDTAGSTRNTPVPLAGEIDADKAVMIAMHNSPRLQVILSEMGLAQADFMEASTISNPVLSAEVRFPSTPYAPFDLSITQSVLDLLRLPSQKKLGAATFEAARYRVAAGVLSFASEVRSDYYDLVAATQQVGMNRALVDASRTAVDLAQRQHVAGNITDLDLENEQAVYEQGKLDLARSEARVLERREALIRILGVSASQSEWSIASDFPPLPAAELAAEDINRVVSEQRLDVLIAQREVEIARRRAPFARAQGVGDFSAGVAHEREPDGEKSTGPTLNVPIPIFNTGRAARLRAEAQLTRATRVLEQVRIDAASEVRAARDRLMAARARVEYYREVLLPRRRRIVELTKLEQNAMLVGLYQLLQARQNEVMAQREGIDAQREYWSARTELDQALSGTNVEGRGMPARQESQQRSVAPKGGH